jgi:hypothetical protein
MQEAYQRKAETIFYVLLLGVIGVVYMLIVTHITSNYHPVWSDEYFYFMNAASFAENHTLQAALTFNGKGSELLGADAHGPAYPLLHGTIAGLVGWHSRNLVWFNLAAVVAAVGLILSAKYLGWQNRLKISCLLLLFPFIALYGVTYMQEMVHVLVAVLLNTLIWRVYSAETKRRDVALFIAVVLLAGMFRGLWLFWLIGLVPSAKNGKRMIGFLLLFLLGAAGSFYYTRLFLEAVPNTFSDFLATWHQGDLWEAIILLFKHFLLNLRLYLTSSPQQVFYLPMKFTILGLAGFFAVRAYLYKARLDTALAAIAAVNLLLLLVVYDAHSWREVRTMAPLYCFLLPCFILQTRPLIHFLAAGGLCVLFWLALPTTNQWVAERNASDLPSTAEKNAFQELRKFVPGNKIILVDFFPRDNSRDLLDLPLRNSQGQQLKYIVHYYSVPLVKYDYILCRPHKQLNRPVITENDYYKLVLNN